MPRPGSRQSSSEGGSGFYLVLLFVTALGTGWFLAPMIETAVKNAQEAASRPIAITAPPPEDEVLPPPPQEGETPVPHSDTVAPEPTPVIPTNTPIPTATPRIVSLYELKSLLSADNFLVTARDEREYIVVLQKDDKWNIFGWEPTVGSVKVSYRALTYVDIGVDLSGMLVTQEGNKVLVNVAGPKIREPIAVVGRAGDPQHSGISTTDGVVQLPDAAQEIARGYAREAARGEPMAKAREEAKKNIEQLIKSLDPNLEPIVVVGEPQH